MLLPSAVRGGCRIWLRQESLRHILASHGYAPGTIAVNVTWIGFEREFNVCQSIAACTHLSSTISHQHISSNVRHFSTFLHILASHGNYASGTIAVNVTRGWKVDSMLVKCLAAYTHISSTISEIGGE